MNVYRMVFSPTGGTRKAADVFTDRFCSESILIDLTDRELDFSAFSFREEDICIVAVPSYGGRIPRIVDERLRKMQGNKARAIPITVYGNRDYDDTMLELNDTLSEAGFCPVAAVAAVAEHSIMHQFATGRPDAEDSRELADFADRIKEGIQKGVLADMPAVPGNRPYRTFDGVPMKPKAGKACTGCGICAQKCPVGAIPTDDPASTDHDRCITCMRCIAVCPQENRSVNKLLVAAGAQKLKKACRDRKKNQLFGV